MTIGFDKLFFFGVILVLNLSVLVFIIITPLARQSGERKRKKIRALITTLAECISSEDKEKCELLTPDKKDWKIFTDEYIVVRQSVLLSENCIIFFSNTLERWGKVNLLIKWLLKGNRYKRSYAAATLGYVKSLKASNALAIALEREKSISIKRYIVNSLAEQRNSAAIPAVIDVLKGLDPAHRISFWSILTGYREKMLEYFPVLKERKEKEIQLFLIYYASCFPSSVFRDYIIRLTESEEREVAAAAVKAAAESYFNDIDICSFLDNPDPEIRTIAVSAAGANPSNRIIAKLIDLLADKSVKKRATAALSLSAGTVPRYYNSILQRLFNEQDTEISSGLIDVISLKMEYIFKKLLGERKNELNLLVKKIVYSGKTSRLINFLNRNHDAEIEEIILEVIRELDNPMLMESFEIYLDDRILAKTGLSRKVPVEKPRIMNEKVKLPLLYIFLIFTILVVPVSYGVFAVLEGLKQPLVFYLKHYLRVYSDFFAYYAIALNSIYAAILVLSFTGIITQARFFDFKKTAFLFKKNILPSVSVIAPAYNEESTIIESINSLLNMRYPDFEVIVVNDGSKDNTLKKVINYFELSRREINFEENLKTKEVRAVYRGSKYPGLLLVDKANGGKADSLNCGINASTGEYFAGIDSDSLLERDSLLRMTASFLDRDQEVAAAGGNIFPVNGCEVRKGEIKKIRTGKKSLVRFQTVEYIRSFMAGRIGWAHINSLLIISGAFGIFNRARVLDIHGYMTESGMLDKDTVGEDMELVVRINRNISEKKDKAVISYIFNANCWTEIPETWSIFRKQRDRWQRGLIDILTYHFAMMFNPAYGKPGMLAFPYFFFFEMLGPWFELHGFAAFIAALAMGLLDAGNVLFFLTAAVFYSLFVTLCSIYLSEIRTSYFGFWDKLILIIYALLENAGFRQAANWFRVKGYISSLRKVSGWGKMERKGFTVKK